MWGEGMPQGPEEDVRSFEAGVTGSYEFPIMGAENQIQILWKNIKLS